MSSSKGMQKVNLKIKVHLKELLPCLLDFRMNTVCYRTSVVMTAPVGSGVRVPSIVAYIHASMVTIT